MYWCIRHYREWLIAMLIGTLAYNALIPIHYDEAYYWTWAQQPALGYFDHPPMVAYIIWLTTLGSDQAFWVRLGSVICTCGCLYFFYHWVSDTHNQRVAKLAILMLAILPIIQINATIITPDAPMIFFWSLGLFASWRAITRNTSGYWYLTGMAIGLMVASKLLAIFFILPLVIYILGYRRDLLCCVHLWLAAALSVLPTLGMLYWNSQHDWTTFAYQLMRASHENAFPNYRAIFEHAIGYVLLLTPLMLVLVVTGMWQRIKGNIAVNPGESFALIFCAVIFGFFLYKSTESVLFHNWYAPIVITLVPMVARDLLDTGRSRLTLATLTVAAVLILLVRLPWITGFGISPLKHNYGYALAITEFAQDLAPGEVLCSDYYTMSAMLRYQLRDSHQVATPFARRASQFDIWQQPTASQCHGLIFRSTIPQSVIDTCSSLDNVQTLRFTVDTGYAPAFQRFTCQLQ